MRHNSYIWFVLKLFLLWVLAAAILLFWLLPLACRAQDVSPYDPRIDGTWTQYEVYGIVGWFHRDTRQIEIRLPAYPIGMQTVVWRTIAGPNSPILGEMFFAGPASSATLNTDGNGLFDQVQACNGVGLYIGEVGNPSQPGFTMSPAEPKVPVNPTGHEHYEIDHWVQNTVNGTPVNVGQMHTSFYAITGPGYAFQGWPDCVWTSLEERPGDPNADYAYNYVFARGIGLVAFWFGRVNTEHDTIGDFAPGQGFTAALYMAVAWGKL